eukprot:CAMPEP_0197620692 /NCGR_PEP_ID=MMETSP1338-20131121/1479_1 /TAXON_ID=43686 ORGANISM="Pelagodinium beii, Strain RCC1491" /NCGR_SAMPLE_ID=MMETSP1338 /ASSEMBLY_ACC=CAM_ASM_000754 /LENGTH=216 /DNA_ID=CAMNT_0043189949 /DNA_START=58 /DNA_END=705 /DNA_ORIENTATION=+
MGNCGGRSTVVKDGAGFYGKDWMITKVPTGVAVHDMGSGAKPGASFAAKIPENLQKLLKDKGMDTKAYDEFKTEMAKAGEGDGWDSQKVKEVCKTFEPKFLTSELKLYYCHVSWTDMVAFKKMTAVGEPPMLTSSWLEIVDQKKASSYTSKYEDAKAEAVAKEIAEQEKAAKEQIEKSKAAAAATGAAAASDAEKEKAATKIQAVARGNHDRKEVA